MRIATHAAYRDVILDSGLEYYPLAGDPLKLSEYMVKSQGCVVPLTSELLYEVKNVE